MDARGLLLLALIAIVECVSVKDLYPHGGKRSAKLNHGDVRKSTQISLAVPAKFYDREYDYLWVHVDGFISFQPDASDAPEQDFPFNEALLAPFMADLDTTNHGEVFYREHHDRRTLTRATLDVRRAFDDAIDFEAESVFIVTWKDVAGSSLNGDLATFTFQSVLVSNGRDTYVIFLYPEHKMGVMLEGISPQDPIFRARAGFNNGPSKFLDMFPVESLVDYRNTDRNGEWIFQVGGEGVRRNNDVITPRVSKHRKRQAGNNIYNPQDVTLTEGDEDVSIVFAQNPTLDYCSRVENACPDPNSRCTNYPSGYCCKCVGGYFGNGAVCLGIENPIRTNGNVSGTVDVMTDSGDLLTRELVSGRFHSYVIPNQGRAYTAVSGLSPVLGRALQPMSVIGEIVGWLFADSGPGAANGFHYTGGNFQRRVSLSFSDKRNRFDMRQTFKGITMEGDIPVVLSQTDVVGRLPNIDPESDVTMGDLVETYTKAGRGQITSSAQRTYSVNNNTHSYNVTQTIIFSECTEASRQIPDRLSLKVFGIFLNYHDDDNNVRYAMNNQIKVPDGTSIPSPCVSGTHDCGTNAICEPQGGTNYNCRCVSGYLGDGRTCEPVIACATAVCPANSVCVDTAPGSHRCDCAAGFERNAVGECAVPPTQVVTQPPAPTDPCTSAPCGAGSCASIGSTYSCNCHSGYYFDGQTCQDLDECVENRHNCAVDATCTNLPGSFSCNCNPGFEGDGVNCAQSTGASPELTECQKQYNEADEFFRNNHGLQDGPEYPECSPDGNFAHRQCNDFTQVCWCVDPILGVIFEETMTEPGMGYNLVCPVTANDILETTTVAPPATPPSHFTQCQTDRWEGEQSQARNPSRVPLYTPLCTQAGAYEPLQYHPDRYFICVDFNGVEVSRHREQPECLTVCQQIAYYADTENIFLRTNKFVPQCTDDGAFARVQCDVNTRSCYCVDQKGIEVQDTRLQTENQDEIVRANFDCDRLAGPQGDFAAQLLFTQAMGYNSVPLPITDSSVAKRIYSRAGQTAVGVAFDCAKQTVYWTDVSGGGIYKAPLTDPNSRKTVVKKGIRSPEGVAVDYVSGNVYWTDTGMNQIQVARADGSNKMTVVSTGIVDPRGIAVDPFGAKIYWSDWDRSNPRLMEANMDGTNARTFLNNGVYLPNDLTIDQVNRRLCYLDAGHGHQKVECMNLDGTQRRVVVDITTIRNGIRPFGLDVDGDMVYFSDRSGHLYAVDTHTNEWVSTSGPVGAHGQMFGVAIAFTQCAGGVNGCSRLYGGCSHLCLPVAGGRVCKCPSGAVNCSEQ